jgi:hypothetical protein
MLKAWTPQTTREALGMTIKPGTNAAIVPPNCKRVKRGGAVKL